MAALNTSSPPIHDGKPPPLGRGGRFAVRSELLDRLMSHREACVVSIVAPPGYGKTTLLSQWLERDVRPSALVTVDRYDNDPVALLTNIRDALTVSGLLTERDAAETRTESAHAPVAAVGMLARALFHAPPGLLVIDQAEELASPSSRDVMGELAIQLPSGFVLAVASRSSETLPTGGLRARGDLLEISAADLRLSTSEANQLLADFGIGCTNPQVEAILKHTEGWPVGVLLSALAVGPGCDPEALLKIRGDDRFIAEYFRSEVLDSLSTAHVRFLILSSILDELSGPMCDYVLDRTGSQRVLESIATSSALIEPLDHSNRAFRCHRLLRECLAAELELREPGLRPQLHQRAASWYGDHDAPIEAMHHAMVAGDEDRAAHLIASSARTIFAGGLVDTVLGWLAWFDADRRLERHPDVALIGFFAHAFTGDEPAARRWLAFIKASRARLGPLEPLMRLATSLSCRSGTDQMLSDARSAQDGLTPTSEWYAAAIAAEGLALVARGDDEGAVERLRVAAETAERYEAPPASVLSLSAMAMLAIKAGDLHRAEDLVFRTQRMLRKPGLQRYAIAVLASAVAARCAIRQGNPASARDLIEQAHTLRTSLSAVLPVVQTLSLLELARAEIEVGHIAGARQVLREASVTLEGASLGELEDSYQELDATLASLPAGHVGAATLTNAELRLLPYLVTHLSFPAIGERLCVSRYTVKTQAASIYRKLGASSRAEAVELAREMHLLDS